MPKKVIRDIVKTRVVDDRAHHQQARSPRKDKDIEIKLTPKRKRPTRLSNTRRGLQGSQRWGMWSLAGIIIVILVFVGFFVFSHTVVEVSPVQAQVTVSGDFQAQSTDTVIEGGLPFSVLTVEKEASVTIPATQEKQVQRRAQGTIVVYNAYSSRPQRLIKNTRFETSEGKIYRINSSIEVPGMTKSDGKDIPGSVETMVYADEPGAEYNIGLVDFTIPGFKGDPRYSAFYARSKTPMTGGVNGTVKIAPDDAIMSAKERVQNTLKADLTDKIHADLPDNVVLYDRGIIFSYSDGDAMEVETEGDVLTIAQKGVAHAMIFNKKDLGSYIAKRYIPNYNDEPVMAHGIEGLTFSFSGKDGAPSDLEGIKTVNVHLEGDLSFEWSIDDKALLADLVGSPKADFSKLIETYPSVQRARATVRPFWRDTFPSNENDIIIKKVYDNDL